MIKIKRLHDVGRRRFLGLTAGALATAQVVTNQTAKVGPILEASVRRSEPEAGALFSPLRQIDAGVLYWVTNTAISSARLYWDTAQISTGGGFFDVRGVTIPPAVSAFPDEIYAAPRSWAERAYPKLIYYNKLDKRGHFVAWEQPALFSSEMRTAFRSLRQSI